MIINRLESIRSQIIAFAIVAALIPSLIISLIAYGQSRRALTEKITQELVTTASQVARETDVWLKERLYDLRVFAGSIVVSEALARRTRRGRLTEYLSSVRARFSDYEEIQVVDAKGGLLASSASHKSARRLPEQWDTSVDPSRNFIGEPYWDEKASKVVVVLGVPVTRGDGRLLGALVAYVNFAGLEESLSAFSTQSMGHVYLATERGVLLVGSNEDSAGQEAPLDLAPEIAEKLRATKGEIVELRSIDDIDVLASARQLSQAVWLAVADRPVSDAYELAIQLRSQAFAVITVLLAIIAIVAYWLASLIAGPLVRLSGAAARVTSGDLSVGLPEGGRGEVGYLTQVFNTMIESLRKSREELERLSATDMLTGLGNRRYLMEQLSQETERANRSGQSFSVLILDVDHFKKYNDTYGHQTGDDVLERVGSVLRSSIRPYDCAARYGGEEFAIMLSGASIEHASETAERIRMLVREEEVEGGPVTVSIGVAEYSVQGDTAEAVIARADAALYEAKRAGRDRIVRDSTGEPADMKASAQASV